MPGQMLSVTFPSGKTLCVPSGTPLNTLLSHFSENVEHILAVKVNNGIEPFDKPLEINSYLEPVLDSSKDGAQVYRRSLCLLLAAAAHKLFPLSRLLCGHSLGSGYYYTLETGKPISKEQIAALEKEMRLLVATNLPITVQFVSYTDAVSLFEALGRVETRLQLNYFCPPRVKINSLDNFSDLYFGPLVPSTGFLKTFGLLPYGKGFLLRFPQPSAPDELPEFVDQPQLFEIYSRYKEWGKRIGVTSAATLNKLVNERRINDFIDIAETFQQRQFADVADQIAKQERVRAVLIAGPSSSGKTTSAKKLALELQAIGYLPHVLSLDSYYVGRDKNPKDENGNYDYECLEALDIDLLNDNLLDLFDGKEVRIPSYNFQRGERYYEDKNTMKLADNEILIIEGIHGLNDKLTSRIPHELKFKIYLSALTQLNLDDHNRISTSDNRLIRRIVRDSQFRGKSAAETISMWPSVQAGEQKHIFPYQINADAMLNTALDYELAVLKVYADPLLRCVNPTQKEYGEACRLLSFLYNFSPIPPTAVPARSIMREFIGGSAFHY
ncbi:nucleoside kinase [Treponema socranskii]|uniref:uridine kinase family protein n=1 Tax=Treponema socranskii TaxID=53419 RepID=UPI003D8D789F